MKHRLAVLASVALLGSAGCGVIDNADTPVAPRTVTEAATTPAETELTSGNSGSVRDEGDLPDPCTLLSRTEVTSLTGRKITQIDEDGGSAGDVTRFCQWQQDGGQLALFLSRTTADEFQVTVAEAESVDDIGDAAFSHSGHLYVLYSTVQVDVYSRGGTDRQNLADEKKVATAVLPKI